MNRHKQNYISPIVWPKIPFYTYILSRHPCLESSNLKNWVFRNSFFTVHWRVSVQLSGSCPLSQKKFCPQPRVTFDLLKFTNYWLDLFCHQFLCSIIAYIQEKKSAHCVNFFLFAKSPQKLTQLALITTCFRKWFGFFYEMWFSWLWQNAKTCWDGLDKMPTKNWDGQNANHRKKSGQNANFWLAFCPVGILSYHLAYWVDVYMVPVFLVYDQYFLYFLKRQVSFPGTGQKI